MKITLLAKSSSGGCYNVVFDKAENLLTVVCDCSAGEWGFICKHKMQLLKGNESMLFDSSLQKEDFHQVQDWASMSSLNELVECLELWDSKRKEAEKKIRKLIKKAKLKLSEDKNFLNVDDFGKIWAPVLESQFNLEYLKYMSSKDKQKIEKLLWQGF